MNHKYGWMCALTLWAAGAGYGQEVGWPVNAVKLAPGQSIVIDGEVSAEEYAGAQAMAINEETLAGVEDPHSPGFVHGGVVNPAADAETPLDDYNATYYFMWDDENFYAALEVSDDSYFFAGPDPNGADTLQFVFAEAPDIPDTLEMFIPTVAPEGTDLEPVFKNAFPTWIDFIDLSDSAEFDGKSEEPDAGNWEVEIRIPWASMTGGFFNEKFPPSEGDTLGFQVLAIDYDFGSLEWFATNHTHFPWDGRGVERITFVGPASSVDVWELHP